MIFYDLETTGINVLKDRIIEVFAFKVNEAGNSELHYILNPGIPIPKGASDIHGYTDEFVKDKPFLKDVISQIYEFFSGEDLVGYNNRKFDNLLLKTEFSRYGYDFDLTARKVLDVYEMWGKFEPRSLAGALKRFCNETSENLHGAKEDVLVMHKIFTKMLDAFTLSEKSFDEVCELSCADQKLIMLWQVINRLKRRFNPKFR